jgi:hypothetical protein
MAPAGAASASASSGVGPSTAFFVVLLASLALASLTFRRSTIAPARARPVLVLSLIERPG